MKVEIRKSTIFNEWIWTCPVCHYGCNIPWESTANWADAIADVESHIDLHTVAGQRLEWALVSLSTGTRK